MKPSLEKIGSRFSHWWAFLVLFQCLSTFQAINGYEYKKDLLELKSSTPQAVQQQSVLDLIGRVLSKEFVPWFEIRINDTFHTTDKLDKFKIEVTSNQTIRIEANSGVSAANGFNYLLKFIANCSVTWSGDQVAMPPKATLLAKVKANPVEMVIQNKFRYYQNVCTVSYSMAWWDWPRWQREIDWMALNGINLPLAFNGQETVFRSTFQRFNMTLEEIDNYFTGPAFLAWNRMGNIQTWTGPLTENWHNQQVALQHKILKQMRNFGMWPVVPGFAGHVPRALQQRMPKAKVDKLTDWNRFGQNYSYTYFLEPEDPNFVEVGKVFIEEYTKLFGTDHFYNIDLFNEETPPSKDASYLQNVGKHVFESIEKADPKGIWIMQGWLFENQPSYWGKDQVKALVSSVPIGKMIILDLYSELHPVYNMFDGYYGQLFIWNMLQNFGGVMGMYGAFDEINQKVYLARKNYSNMIGIGLTPEGIKQNDIVYDYMMETIWHSKAPDMVDWIRNYSQRRYGFYDNNLETGLQLLRRSVYNDTRLVRNHGVYPINRRPSLKTVPTMWYKPYDVILSLKSYAKFLHQHSTTNSSSNILSSQTFTYDMVDLSRQSLQLIFDHYNQQLRVEFHKKQLESVEKISKSMLYVLDLMESVLECNDRFLLYNWIRTARDLGSDAKEKDFNEEQARNQITVWGFNANILDYAAKQWSGMVKYYYRERWNLFLGQLTKSLKDNSTFNVDHFNADVYRLVELPFTKQHNQNLTTKATPHNLPSLVQKIVEEADKTITH